MSRGGEAGYRVTQSPASVPVGPLLTERLTPREAEVLRP
jgi:hypothetical protein